MRILSLLAVFGCLFLAACAGSSGSAPPDPDKADSREIAAAPGEIEIPLGAPASRVLQLLGPAEDVKPGPEGREIWRYSGKRADYVYASNSNHVQTLVIGEYSHGGGSGGLPLLLTIIFDPTKKVADFNFAQVAF